MLAVLDALFEDARAPGRPGASPEHACVVGDLQRLRPAAHRRPRRKCARVAPPPHRLHGLWPDETHLSISPRKWILLKAAREEVVDHAVLHATSTVFRSATRESCTATTIPSRAAWSPRSVPQDCQWRKRQCASARRPRQLRVAGTGRGARGAIAPTAALHAELTEAKKAIASKG